MGLCNVSINGRLMRRARLVAAPTPRYDAVTLGLPASNAMSGSYDAKVPQDAKCRIDARQDTCWNQKEGGAGAKMA